MSDEGVGNSGFLKRWSRRKQQLVQEVVDSPVTEPSPDNVPLVPPAQPPGTISPLDTETGSVKSEVSAAQAEVGGSTETPDGEKVLTDDDMPAVDTLSADSDYSPFLSEGVSKELRNLALKKLFFSGKFAARDGLDDYDDDFTRFEPLGDTVTSDMKFHQRRKERERLARLEEEERQRLAQQAGENEEDADENKPESDEAVVEKQANEADVPESDTGEQSTSPDDKLAVEPALLEPAAEPMISDASSSEPQAGTIQAGGGKLSRKPATDSDPSRDHESGHHKGQTT